MVLTSILIDLALMYSHLDLTTLRNKIKTKFCTIFCLLLFTPLFYKQGNKNKFAFNRFELAMDC